jgi:predicted nucleic acid-binding protein
VDVLLDVHGSEPAASRILDPGETLHAPHLIDVEVGHALRRHAALGDLPPARGEQAIGDLLDLPITRYPHELLLRRAWQLRSRLTFNDAMYVALAELLVAPLITRDSKLARTTGHSAEIELI